MDKVTSIDSISSPLKEGSFTTGRQFVLLDGAFDEDLPGQVYRKANDGLPTWYPLVAGTPYSALYPVSPCLIDCEQQPELRAYASDMLEQLDAGCVFWLENGHEADLAAEHCRSLLTAKDERHQPRLFRFYEPRWLEPLFQVLTPEESAAFLGPFVAIAWRNERGWRQVSRLVPWDGQVKAPGWLWLDADRQQQLHRARLPLTADRLAADYLEHLPASAHDTALGLLEQADHWGYNDLASQERWVRLYLTKPAGFLESVPAQQLLNRQDLGRTEKLDELESLVA